jgi:hypothetical protein
MPPRYSLCVYAALTLSQASIVLNMIACNFSGYCGKQWTYALLM